MKRGQGTWIALVGVFLLVVVMVNMFGGRNEKPYSSYNTGEDGTKAAYLLLEELGFDVQRKTGAHWEGEGTLVALGPDYLGNTGEALLLADDYRFTNDYIQHYAVEFVELMWPYADGPIVFEEYGRAVFPRKEPSGEMADVTLLSIMPPWLKITLAHVLAAAALLLFFYQQRMGKPKPPEGFEGRAPLEGVHAMSAALGKAGVYKDSAAYYYRYQARNGNGWDRDRAMERQLASIDSEHSALQLVAQIDQMIKEYRHEG